MAMPRGGKCQDGASHPLPGRRAAVRGSLVRHTPDSCQQLAERCLHTHTTRAESESRQYERGKGILEPSSPQ